MARDYMYGLILVSTPNGAHVSAVMCTPLSGNLCMGYSSMVLQNGSLSGVIVTCPVLL